MPDLKPLDAAESENDAEEPKAGYLLLAGIACGLIIAFGSQALRGHFDARPELAQADPLMVGLIRGAFWFGWAMVLVCSGVLVWALQKKKALS